MSLSLEWSHRIECWKDALPAIFYTPVGDVELSYFVSDGPMLPEEARTHAFTPIKPGETWGHEWQKGWFKGKITLPASVKGQRVVLKLEPGGFESIVWLDGVARGARDFSGRELLLAKSAKGTETFDLLAETFAGNQRQRGGGPTPQWVDAKPANPAPVTLGHSTFGVWNEDAFQLWIDVECLYQLRQNIKDQESLRVAKIDEALKEFTRVVDLELPAPARDASIREGRKVLKEALAAHNGSTAPMMSVFGHSHLDIMWLWTLEETERKSVRTFTNQLALMEQYPEYKFLQSQPYLYDCIKRDYPEVYQRIKAAVKRGQWIPEGAMWVESDTNIPSGESLIRQVLKGKKFFKDEFGVDSQLMWLPDVFGYSGAIPQIMKGCGIRWFTTQKLLWSYNGGEPFPYNLFWWQGIDGSRALAYMHNDYNSHSNPQALIARWNERVQKDAIHDGRLVPFGYGDGGGGPTRNHLEFLRREADLEGMPRTRMVAPMTFLEEANSAKRLPTYVGELYFQCHRGTYTTQAKTKRANRKGEVALHELEFWGTVASMSGKKAFPAEKADTLWKDVLLNQFHDAIAGSSISEVHQQGERELENVIKEASSLTRTMLSSLVKPNRKKVSIFNSISSDRWAVVEIPFKGCMDEDGEPMPVQEYDGKYYTEVYLPACGWTTLQEGKPYEGEKEGWVSAKKNMLQNSIVTFKFNKLGEVVSAHNRGDKDEFMAAPGNALRMYKDVPSKYDAWDIDSIYEETPVDLEQKATIEVLTAGPVFGMIRVTRKIHNSGFSQDIVLTSNGSHLEFRTTIDWKENHKLLKVNFPVTVQAEDAIHEIQFGHVKRPTHASRPYDANRFEVCNQRWTALVEAGQRGTAILNDCKYGVNVAGNSMNLTLLRSPLSPDHWADKGVHTFTYAFTFWTAEDAPNYVNLPVTLGYELNIPVHVLPGDAGEGVSLLRCDAASIIVESMKPAEDNSGDIILRLYESNNTRTSCDLHLNLPFSKVLVTDMLEGHGEELPVKTGGCDCCCQEVALDFHPFEIKTIRLVK